MKTTKPGRDFVKVLGDFYKEKNEFYKQRKSNLKSELEKKLQSVKRQKHYKILPIGNRTTEKIIQLQNDWKKTGYVPKNQSENIWIRFRNACNTFFDKKKAHFKELDAIKIDNLKNKTAFLNELRKRLFKQGKR